MKQFQSLSNTISFPWQKIRRFGNKGKESPKSKLGTYSIKGILDLWVPSHEEKKTDVKNLLLQSGQRLVG